jgi:nitrite reductase/ring-hydroxylating ferredoxin subunit
VGDSVVALFNIDGCLFAIDDTCVCCGSSLSKGKLEPHQVICADCGWQYDLVTGCVAGLPALRIDRYDVKVVDAHLVLGLTPLPNS